MKPPSSSLALVRPAAILLALFAAGSVLARALALPLPASVVGLGLVLLGLRLGAIKAAADEARVPVRPTDPSARGHEPALRAANG
jgi:hypothetical protein